MPKTSDSSATHRSIRSGFDYKTLARKATTKFRQLHFGANYDPEHEAIDLKETALSAKTLSFFSMFRYSTLFDYILMAFGIGFALTSGLLLPALVYTLGLFFVYAHEMEFECEIADDKRFIYTHLGLYLAIAFLITSFSFHCCFMWSAGRQLTRIRLAYMEAILRKDFAFLDNYIDRDLALRFTNDITDMRYGIGENIPKLIMYVESSLVLLIIAFVAHAELALVTLVCVPLFSITAYIRLKVAETLMRKEQEQYSRADSMAAEILSSIKAVKVFQGEEKERERYAKALFSMRKLWGNVIIAAGSCGLMWILPAGLQAIMYYMYLEFFEEKQPLIHDHCIIHENTYFLLSGLNKGIKFSVLYFIFLAVLFASMYCALIPVIIEKVRRSQRIAAEVFFTIDWASRIDNLSETGEIPRKQAIGKLEMYRVCFRYPRKSTVMALNNVSFTIYPGQMVCIFGPVKCGKTAIIHLLARIYDACSGQVKLDGIDVDKLNVPWLRSQFGIISQDQELFNATIEENVRFGKLSASMDDIVDACKETGVHNDIMSLDDGYSTVAGFRSTVKLTDLQTKKIHLARLILQNPKIMILDDYITNADEEFEDFLMNLFDRYREKTTIILTTDKVNSIVKTCDVIFSMRDGRVVEIGNHEDLFEKQGSYFDTIHDNLEEKFGQKPFFTSQLTSYKFAAAIKRKHQLHDIANNNTDYAQLLKNKSLFLSSYLRHTDPMYNQRRVQPRVMGGFHRYQVYNSIQTNAYYYTKLVRSTLLRERDLRQKLLEPKHFMLSSSDQRLSPLNTPTVTARGRNSTKNSTSTGTGKISPWQKTLLASVIKTKSKIRATRNSDDTSAGDTADQNQDSSSSLNPGKLKSKKSSVFFFEAGQTVSDEKLQHYLGWTINSSPDNESISSDDSHAFWDVYSRNLQSALSVKLNPKNWKAWKEYLKLMRFSWPYLLVSSFTSFIIGICSCGIIYEESILFPHYTSYLYSKEYLLNDSSLTEKNLKAGIPPYENRGDLYNRTCVFMVLFSVIAAISATVQELILSLGIFRSNNAMRQEIFSHFLEQDLEWFDFPEHDIGSLCDCLATQTASVQTTFAAGFTLCFQSLAMLIFVLVAFFDRTINDGEYDNEVYVLLLLIPLTIFFGYFEESMLGRFNAVVAANLEQSSKIQYIVITNLRDVIILNLGSYFQQVHAKSLHDKLNNLKFTLHSLILRPLGFAMSKATYFLIFHIWLWVQAKQLEGKEHEPPQVAAKKIATFYLLAQLFVTGVFQIGAAIATIPHAEESLTTADMILSVERKRTSANEEKNNEKVGVMQDGTGAQKFQMVKLSLGHKDPPPDIELFKVQFAYPVAPELYMLKSVSLKIDSLKFVAVVGPIKSGKSALVGLLLKLYFPTSGALTLGTKNYKEIQDESLRRIVSLVEQDPTFLNMTIAENIAYGDNSRTVSMDEITSAAKLSHIHDVIMEMTDKYDTQVSQLPESPATFVFRQRLAVARVVIKNPKILIIDEATTSIDVKNYELLQESLNELKKGRTIIVTSQRIEPIRKADTIVVLKNGEIAEMGTDSDLLAKKGIYYEIFMSQRLFEFSNKSNRDFHKRQSRSIMNKSSSKSVEI